MHAVAMTKLLNKLERRLGTKLFNLHESIAKESWADVIIDDTLETFSRFYPYKVEYEVNVAEDAHKQKEGYFYIDEDKYQGNVTIYGLKDINFSSMLSAGVRTNSQGGYSIPVYNSTYGYEDIAMGQMRSDLQSFVNTGIYPTYEHPNLIKVEGAANVDLTATMSTFKVDLLVKHADSLVTVSPTKMETFEELAELDIKIYLWNALKHFRNIPTVYGELNLNIDEWESALEQRKDFVKELREQYVAPDNFNQPIMLTI